MSHSKNIDFYLLIVARRIITQGGSQTGYYDDGDIDPINPQHLLGRSIFENSGYSFSCYS